MPHTRIIPSPKDQYQLITLSSGQAWEVRTGLTEAQSVSMFMNNGRKPITFAIFRYGPTGQLLDAWCSEDEPFRPNLKRE